MSEPTGTVSATGGYKDSAGYWHPHGCRCDECADEAYTPNPHPNKLDEITNTIWEWSEDAETYVDSGREPTIFERWVHAMTPMTVSLSALFPKTTRVIAMGESGPQMKAEWGWRHEED